MKSDDLENSAGNQHDCLAPRRFRYFRRQLHWFLLGPTLIAAAITEHAKGSYQPTYARLKITACGLPRDFTALLEQLRALGKSRLSTYMDTIGVGLGSA